MCNILFQNKFIRNKERAYWNNKRSQFVKIAWNYIILSFSIDWTCITMGPVQFVKPRKKIQTDTISLIHKLSKYKKRKPSRPFYPRWHQSLGSEMDAISNESRGARGIPNEPGRKRRGTRALFAFQPNNDPIYQSSFDEEQENPSRFGNLRVDEFQHMEIPTDRQIHLFSGI